MPGVFNLAFPIIEGQDLVMQLDMVGIAISFGAACASGTIKESNMLVNMGLTNKEANSSVRLSIGKIHTKENVEAVINAIDYIINTYVGKINER